MLSVFEGVIKFPHLIKTPVLYTVGLSATFWNMDSNVWAILVVWPGGCFSFGPEHIQSPDIWSPSIGPQEQTVPAHLVPETIGPPGQLVPKHLVPMDKWSPGQLVPLDKWSPNIWSPWTNGPPKNWSPWTIGPQNLLVVFKSSLKHFF